MKRTFRHPIRGDRLHPKPSTRAPRHSSWRSDARQPRMRPRKSVNVASIVGSPEEEDSRPSLRLRIVGVTVLVLFGLLVLRLWSLQVIDGKTYAAAVTRNQVRVVSIPAPRGEIVDRNGTVLVSNTSQEEILLSRAEALQDPAIVGMVAALVGQTPAQVKASINNVQYSPYEPVPVAVGVPPATIQYLQTHQSQYPGVSVQTVAQRTYPQGGTTGTQVLGYTGDITSSFLAAHPNQGYTQGSEIGVAGVEAQYEQYLKGVDGRQALSVDASGNVVGTLSTTAPQIGDTLVLNLNNGLQQEVQADLQQQILADRNSTDPVDHLTPKADNGAVIVMNPNNGQVYALASYPSYDLNEWVGGISAANFSALQATGAENDEAIQGLYTPGSTFKLVTATAALQDGLITPTTPYDDTGHYKIPGCPAPGVVSTQGCILNDDPGDSPGEYDVSSALSVSSDSFFYNLGDMFWTDRGQYGDTPIQNEATNYGEGTITGIDLPGEAQGRVDSALVRLKLHAEAPKAFPTTTWYTGDNIEMAFGQGATVLTPIEQAVAYSTFANGGTRYAPQVASEVVDPITGKVVKKLAPQVTAARHHLTGQLGRHAGGLRGRDLEPPRHRLRRLPGLPDLVEPGRQDGHRLQRQGPRAQLVVRGLRPQPQPPVRGAGGHRPRRLRRAGRRTAGARHLRLPGHQPGQPDGHDPDRLQPAEPVGAGHQRAAGHADHDHHHGAGPEGLGHDHDQHDTDAGRLSCAEVVT